MTVTGLLVFMVLSQIAVAAYLLYSFSDVEREARQRNADMRAFIETTLAEMERRLNDTASASTAHKRPLSAVGASLGK